MAEKIIYICDRCGREAEEGSKAVKWHRGYWISTDNPGLICSFCFEQYKVFIANKPTETTYIVQSQ